MRYLRNRKLAALLFSLFMLFVIGCGTGAKKEEMVKTESADSKTVKTEPVEVKPVKIEKIELPQGAAVPKKVRIGIINTKALPPQPVFGFEKGVYKTAFPEIDFQMILSQGHCDVAENMQDSNWDLMYMSFGPAIEFVNYGYDKYKPAKYTILAGAQYGTNMLMAKPDIKGIKDLDGKTVGITNKNHDKEMVLNKLLAKEGLKTTALGGTVKIIYKEPVDLVKLYQKGELQALFPMPSMVNVLQKSGSKILADGTKTFGKNQTFSVLAVSNKFLAEYPDFVKAFLQVHVDTTLMAQQNFNEMVELTCTLENKSFNNDPKRVIPKAEVEAIYKRNLTTYDPNLKYVQDSYKLLQDAKYLKAMPAFDKWADFTMLNEVLKEKGLPEIK